MRSKTGIYVLLILSMALWGGTWVAGRVVAQAMHPMSAATLRFIVASLGLVYMVWRSEGHLPRLTREQVWPAIFLGFTGVFAYSYFFFTGLRTTPAGRAALIVACIPVSISVVSALFFKERFGPVRVVGALCSLAGVSVVIAGGNPLALLSGGVGRGDLLILGCVASWTAYTLGGRSAMRRMDPLTAVTWSCITGTLMLLPVSAFNGLWRDIVNARLVDWGCIFFLGALATSLAYFWYYEAIAIIGASRAGIFINTVPVFAVLMGFFLLGEPIHLSLLAGGTMVIVGVYLTNRP